MDEKKSSQVGRILAVTLALVLIGSGVFVVNSFTGNPISAYFAGRQMIRYVRQTYPEMTLTLSKARYNFKSSVYSLKASSPTSSDTHFNVTRRRDGRVVDDYQDYVLSGFNTVDRLGREMTKEIEPLLKGLFSNQLAGRCFADLFGEHKVLPNVPLDTPYSPELKIPATLYLDFEIVNPSLDDAAVKIQKMDELLKREGYAIGMYIIEVRKRDSKQGYTMRVASDLVNESLPDALKSAFDSQSYNERLAVGSR